jgi:UDP-GlcNAc:undecaprenyl-phosphate/decaprenyl-phosphate GlcNAc-1-phosphate transferase
VTGAGALIGQLAAIALLTGVFPWLGIRMLASSLERSTLAQRTNFRGRRVFVGLGVVWVFWVAGMTVLRWGGLVLGEGFALFVEVSAVLPLVITALLFGLFDDAYGTGEERGFRGHLSALGQGRLTTGAFKLAGIGLVSLAAAVSVDPPANGVASALSAQTSVALGFVGWTAVLGALIALSANLVNLADLRPGRALKVYGVCAVALVAVAAASHPPVVAASLALALAGPLGAAWRFDVSERGMLGDAGANAAGAVLGFVAAWECGRAWPALVVAAVLLALNLASEIWSFSRVIDSNRALSWLDGLGRLPSDTPAETNSAKTSPQSETHDG